MIRIGILALQGNFIQHKELLDSIRDLNIECKLIRNLQDLESSIDAIILPGGESSTIYTLLKTQNMLYCLLDLINNGLPTLATCAGAILLSSSLNKQGHTLQAPTLNLADIFIERNSYGRQYESFSTNLEFIVSNELLKKSWCTPQARNTTNMDQATIPSHIQGLFIRAPRILSYGKNVHVLARYEEDPIIVQEKNMLISTFHPESIPDSNLHRYFINFLIPNNSK